METSAEAKTSLRFWLACIAVSIIFGLIYGQICYCAPQTKVGVGMLSLGLTLLQCTSFYMVYSAFTAPLKKAKQIMVAMLLCTLLAMLFMFMGIQQMRSALGYNAGMFHFGGF